MLDDAWRWSTVLDEIWWKLKRNSWHLMLCEMFDLFDHSNRHFANIKTFLAVLCAPSAASRTLRLGSRNSLHMLDEMLWVGDQTDLQFHLTLPKCWRIVWSAWPGTSTFKKQPVCILHQTNLSQSSITEGRGLRDIITAKTGHSQICRRNSPPVYITKQSIIKRGRASKKHWREA